MGFWSNVFSTYVGVYVLPSVIGSAAVIGVGAYLALRKGFNSASQSVSEGIDSIEDSLSQVEAERLLGSDDIASKFSSMSSTEQSAIVPRWLKSTHQNGRVLTEKELSNLTQCLLNYTTHGSLSRPFYLTSNAETVGATLSLLDRNKGRIPEAVADQIKENIFTTFQRINTPTVQSLDMAGDLSKHYQITPHQASICRDHVLKALSMPISSPHFRQYSHNADLAASAEVQLKALDILFVPRHSHGGEKSASHLSLQSGKYSPEQTSKAHSDAQSLIAIWDTRAQDRSRLPPYGDRPAHPEPNDTIQQAKKVLGLPRETGQSFRFGA